MSNREEFEYEAGQELKLPVSIIKQARMGDGYDHAFDSMNVMQPLNQWWHWWQAGREGMDKKLTDMAVQLANAESKCMELAAVVAENAALKTAAKETLAHWAAAEAGKMELMMDKCMPALRDAYCKTPSTDSFLAEVRAQGVDASIEHLSKKFEGTGHIGVPVMALEWLAQDIRKGAAQ